MAARQCPQCQARIPAGDVVAFTDGMECPGCRTPLEVSTLSRYLATWTGLAAAVAAGWWLGVPQPTDSLGWVKPVVVTFLVFSVVTPVALMLLADLVVRAAEPAPAAAESHSSHGHGSHH